MKRCFGGRAVCCSFASLGGVARSIVAIGIAIAAILLLPQQSLATLSEQFYARVTVQLCQQFFTQNASIDVYYSIGADRTLYPATTVNQQIDWSAHLGTFTVLLPNNLGTTPLRISTTCRTPRGVSVLSNQKTISNCDALSIIDHDGDGLADNSEDTNCNNSFDPLDASNPYNVDTDGDGVRDLVEVLSGKDPDNPGSSPRPYIFSSAPFDPDGDGNANPVVWRPNTGMWFIRDFVYPENHLAIQYGLPGDIPFVYQPENATSEIGVVRNVNNQLYWYFHGVGLRHAGRPDLIQFGVFGDNIVLGPWERRGVTAPAVARLWAGSWTFWIYRSDNSIRAVNWGTDGDIPKVEDYDGDGLFDIAVFRPSTQTTYVIRSSDGRVVIYNFGSGTADHWSRGDFTGDGIDDITFWEPLTGMFNTLRSESGFDEIRARRRDPSAFEQYQLGLYSVHLPLNWNRRDGRLLYTVVDHARGLRFFRRDNNPNAPLQAIQWGLAGDAQG